jgi:predicted alpha/beta-hydrolase family hydrolase
MKVRNIRRRKAGRLQPKNGRKRNERVQIRRAAKIRRENLAGVLLAGPPIVHARLPRDVKA